MSRKKILFFLESLGGGGAEKVLTTLVRNLDQTKFDITVMVVVKTGIYVKDIEQNCRLLYMLPDVKTLPDILSRIKYKIDYKYIYRADIHRVYNKYIHEPYDVEIAFVEGFATKFIAASSNPKSKKIAWIHIDMKNNPYADMYFGSIREERDTYQSFDRIIAVSKSVKDIFEKKFGLMSITDVIYNPIDIGEIRTKAGLKEKDERHKLRIISIGRLARQKGYDRLIKVLAELKEFQFKYILWILGEGSERQKLQEMIDRNQLENNIKLLGFKENPYEWIQQSDVFVCSSRAEGYSLAIAEAIALEKPILSVTCAGPNELLNFGQYGVMVPNTDDQLKHMLYDLLTEKIDLKKYAKLSSERASFLELNNVIERVERLFL